MTFSIILATGIVVFILAFGLIIIGRFLFSLISAGILLIINLFLKDESPALNRAVSRHERGRSTRHSARAERRRQRQSSDDSDSFFGDFFGGGCGDGGGDGGGD
ncbi:hypothetical protein ACYPKM_04875 [Pseudomonas aeruginosa]